MWLCWYVWRQHALILAGESPVDRVGQTRSVTNCPTLSGYWRATSNWRIAQGQIAPLAGEISVVLLLSRHGMFVTVYGIVTRRQTAILASRE